MIKYKVDIEDETNNIEESNELLNNIAVNSNINELKKIKFVPKSQREQNLYNNYKQIIESKEEQLIKIEKKKEEILNSNKLLNNKRSNKYTNSLEDNKLIHKEEEELIKKQYLNIKEYKEPKIYDKNKVVFNFDWDPEDDTSKYGYKLDFEPILSFGKGLRAGIDEEEQLQNVRTYNKLLDNRDKSLGITTIDKNKKINNTNSNKLIKYEDVNTKILENMTDRDWKIFRENNNIIIKGDNLSTIPQPIRSWKELSIFEELKCRLEDLYKKPTAIQMQAIPIGIERIDMIGLSPTGSGKSVAFLIPIINYLINIKLLKNKNNSLCYDNSNCNIDGPYGLIIAPTRELVIQIEDEFIKLSKKLSIKLKSVSLIGGFSIDNQYDKLSSGVDIVIGAPGRTKDCIKRSYVDFSKCNYVIIDEADKIIKDGFEDELKYILDSMNNLAYNKIIYSNKITGDNSVVNNINNYSFNNSYNINNSNSNYQSYKTFIEKNIVRTTMLFSATLNKNIEKLAISYLKNLTKVIINQEEKTDIEEIFENITSNHNKNEILIKTLKMYKPPVIIFLNYKADVHNLWKYIDKKGYNAVEIHGDKTQDQREKALKKIKSNESDILLATSLMARGIDIENVSCVINYDCPKTLEDYRHRIGRTGRAGRKGTSITFLDKSDKEFASLLSKELDKLNKNVPNELIKAVGDKVMYAI